MTATELARASVAAPRPELDWERDSYGRPRILPDPTWDEATRTRWQAGRAWDDGTVGYTRVTTFAEALQDSSALTRWKMRRAVLGMGRRPDYVTAAAALSVRDEDRQALDDLAEKALEAAGPNAADVGTALHAFTERIDRGEELGAVPAAYEGTLAAYVAASRHLRFVDWECRTVCDELETGGTPDRAGFCDIPDPDGVVDELRIIDTKTGRVDYSAGKFSTQLAVYAHSRKYHPGTGARTTWQEAHGAPMSTRWGLVVHVPAGADTAELLWIDLTHGWAGAQHCRQVRDWRTGATAGALLRPVFARAPRPATTDGTCRGRKQDGTACGYRRKTRAEGTAAQFCGRHGEQAADLERWWAENPGADPDGGLETLPARSPVQPSFPADVPAATDVNRHAVALSDVLLTFPGKFPNGVLQAPVGTHAQSTEDGRTWVKARELDTMPAHGWELSREDQEAAAARSVAGQLERREQLMRRDDEGDEAALHEDLPVVDNLSPMVEQLAAVQRGDDPDAPDCAWCSGTGCSVCQPQRDVLQESSMDVAAQAFARAQDAAAAAAPPPARELAAEHRDRTAAAAYEASGGQYGAPVPQGPVGTYALDPAAELNGNPRPVSGLQTPEDAAWALAQARRAVFAQLAAAGSETELQLLYQRHAPLWTAELTEAAGQRSAELAQLQARERPVAALLAALETAPDTGTLHRLFLQYGQTGLWTPEATAAAQARWERLQ